MYNHTLIFCSLDPISIGYIPFAIIPDGNVINFVNRGESPRGRRGGGPHRLPEILLHCYATSGHENSLWIIPRNSSFNATVEIISPYDTMLLLETSIDLLPKISFEKFTCQSTNNQSIDSSIIITSSK